MSDVLPDCMMPDGAEPCRGYQQLQVENEQLRKDLEIWRRNGGDILQRAKIEQLTALLVDVRRYLMGHHWWHEASPDETIRCVLEAK